MPYFDNASLLENNNLIEFHYCGETLSGYHEDCTFGEIFFNNFVNLVLFTVESAKEKLEKVQALKLQNKNLLNFKFVRCLIQD
jgi:hypothetical protein